MDGDIFYRTIGLNIIMLVQYLEFSMIHDRLSYNIMNHHNVQMSLETYLHKKN